MTLEYFLTFYFNFEHLKDSLSFISVFYLSDIIEKFLIFRFINRAWFQPSKSFLKLTQTQDKLT